MSEDKPVTPKLEGVYGTWSGEPPIEHKKQLSRRDVLKMGAGAVAARAIPGTNALADFADRVDSQRQYQEIESPTDIISREELAQRYRTRIHDLPRHQFPNDYVELEFRRAVGEEALFRRLEEGRIIGLDVILVDDNVVDPTKLTSEQREFITQHPVILNGLERKIEEIRELNRQEISNNRDKMRSEYDQKKAELDATKSAISNDRYSVEDQALRYMYDRYLADEPGEQDLKEIGIRGYTSMDGTGRNDKGETGPRSFIFLAVRDRETEITFTSGQETKTISSSRIPYGSETGGVFAPNPEQSLPDENSFRVAEDPNSNGYVVVGGHTPGFIFRHEASHARGVFSEDDADKVALEGIVNAANHMKETGSDEKYWVVFRTPEGITLTKSSIDLSFSGTRA